MTLSAPEDSGLSGIREVENQDVESLCEAEQTQRRTGFSSFALYGTNPMLYSEHLPGQ